MQMEQPMGAIHVPAPTHTSVAFACGHHFELHSKRAQGRYSPSGMCPMCWAQVPRVTLLATRCESWRGGSYSFSPGVRYSVSSGDEQGFSTDESRLEQAEVIVKRVFAKHGLDDSPPGFDTSDETVQTAIKAAVTELLTHPLWVRVGGKHAAQMGVACSTWVCSGDLWRASNPGILS